MIYICIFSHQNGSSPKTVAMQQGHVMVANLLEEYENRKFKHSQDHKSSEANGSEERPTGDSTEPTESTEPPTSTSADISNQAKSMVGKRPRGTEGIGTSIVAAKIKMTLPPIFGDAIPTPKSSPCKTKKLLP